MKLVILRVRTKIILEKFRWALLGIIFLVIIGTLMFYGFYSKNWDITFTRSILDAIIASTGLLIGERVFNFPPNTKIFPDLFFILIYLLYPLLGQIFIVYSVIEVGFTLFQYETRQELWFLALSKNMKKHTVIVGIGHVGKRILEELVKRGDTNIVGITDSGNINNEFIQEYAKKGIAFIFGDGTEFATLEQANILNAKKILIVTNNDMTNFRIAIRVHKLNPKIRTILRIFDSEFAERIRKLPEVDETVSTSLASSTTFIAKAELDGIVATLKTDIKEEIEDQLDIFHAMVLSKVKINDLTQLKTDDYRVDVLDLEQVVNATILAVNGNFHVKEGFPLSVGDKLMVLGSIDEVKKVKKLLK